MQVMLAALRPSNLETGVLMMVPVLVCRESQSDLKAVRASCLVIREVDVHGHQGCL